MKDLIEAPTIMKRKRASSSMSDSSESQASKKIAENAYEKIYVVKSSDKLLKIEIKRNTQKPIISGTPSPTSIIEAFGPSACIPSQALEDDTWFYGSSSPFSSVTSYEYDSTASGAGDDESDYTTTNKKFQIPEFISTLQDYSSDSIDELFNRDASFDEDIFVSGILELFR